MANIITKTFTYDLPDDYLSQERTLGKTAEWTYIGPDEICIVVKKETNQYAGKFLTHDHDKDLVPVALDEFHVHVDCTTDPLLCCLVHAETEKPDYADLEQHEELLPDGLHYRRPLHPPPDHTHDIRDVEFDAETASFTKPFPWKKPHMTWEQLRVWRNGILNYSDDHDHEYMPAELRQAWAEFRQGLRDMPQTHGAYNTHTSIDLTAEAPINTVGSYVIKVIDPVGIEEFDDVGMTGHPVTDIFSDTTTVVSIDLETKLITLDKPLRFKPTELNADITFSPEPHVQPWKVGAHTAPNGDHGPLDQHGNEQDVTAVGNVEPDHPHM